MRALTLHQPFANLIVIGVKRYETRSWAPPVALIGRRIAIHAGRSMAGFDVDDLPIAYQRRVQVRRIPRHLFAACAPLTRPDQFPLGAIVCTVRLVAAHLVWRLGPIHAEADLQRSLSSELDPDCDQRLFPVDRYGDYTAGHWAWRFDQVISHDPPVPARGYQGLWEWTP